MDWFNKKKIKQIESNLKELTRINVDISDSNEFYRIINQFLGGTALERDNLKAAVKKGYEENVSCFGMVATMSTIFSEPEDKLFKIQGDEKVEVEPKDVGITFLDKPNHYQSWSEFKKHWATSFYTTGNSEVYAPKYENGNDQGKLVDNQLFVMPAQGVSIYAKSWQDPIHAYGFDLDGGERKILANDIWHERFAPTLDFKNGANFYGMSPVLVALSVILAQNEGYDFISNTYAKRMPPAILFTDSDYQEEVSEKQRDNFHSAWKKHYSGSKADSKPVVANKGRWEKIGFDSFRDLQVLDTLADGQRQLATAFGIDSRLFNDIAGSTFNNQQEAFKKMYAMRIKPDWRTFYNGINTDLICNYGEGLVLEPDFTKIEALKKDLKLIAEIYKQGVLIKASSLNEYREAIGQEVKEDRDDMNATGDEVLDSFPSLNQVNNNLNNQ